jgi:hypothetical protein
LLLLQLAIESSGKDKQQGITKIVLALTITVRLSSQPCQIATQPIIHAFNDERIRLAAGVLLLREDGAIGRVVVAGVVD